MTVYLVGAGPGDPGLITRRGAELLGRADVVVHDRLVPRALLSLAPAHALVLDVGKEPGRPRRQEEIDALLVEHGLAGRTVVRLKGGDPFVFGRGGEEALALRRAGVEFEVVPGVTAAFAVPAYAGVPVTHRGLATSVTVVTGRVGRGPEPTGGVTDAAGGISGVDWESLAAAGGTLVVLMGMEHRAAIAERLVAGGRRPETPVVVVQQGTTIGQRVARCTLAGLHAVELGAPATIVVGEVAGLALDWFSPGALAGVEVVVTRAADRAGGLVTMLESAGAEVLCLPVVDTADPEDGGAALRRATEDPGSWSWIVFSSATAVRRFLAVVGDGRRLAGVKLAAVGPVTAAALAEHALNADVVAEPATAEGLVSAMPDARAGDDRVLYPRAADARAVLADGLRAKRWQVEEVVAYRTVAGPVGVDGAVLDRAAGAQVLTFTSPSTVRAYLAVAGDRPVPPVVACIGPVTAEAARAAGLSVTVEADEHSAAGLVQAVVDAVSGGAAQP